MQSPPLSQMKSVGSTDSEDFETIGDEFLRHFKNLCGLQQYESVLDVGCGTGRMALPLVDYLNGQYEGIDIMPDCIKWCKENITPLHPNFHFTLADIYNKEYNPQGKYRASEFKFPYRNNYFDFIFLASVFTHMLPEDFEHYISEISRVLKEGGRCLVTYFLLNKKSIKSMQSKKAVMYFNYKINNNCMSTNETIPEQAVSYRENYVVDQYARNLLKIKAINYGAWCNSEKYLSGQDIVVAEKERNKKLLHWLR